MRITDREAKFKELKEQSDSRKYKDEKQKNLLANKVVFIGFLVTEVAMLVNLVACIQDFGNSVLAMSGLIIDIIGIFAIIVTYLKDRESGVMFRLGMIQFVIMYLIVVIENGNDCMMFIPMPLLVTVMMYSQPKSTKVFCCLLAVVDALRFMLLLTGVIHSSNTMNEERMVSGLVLVTLLAIYQSTKVLWRFSRDSVGAVQDEEQIQKLMMEDILEIVKGVQSQTREANHLLDHLYSSAESISDSVSGITIGTQSTAEGIQNQTEMTHSIQNAIESAAGATKEAVDKTEDSMKAVSHNLEVMKQLDIQANSISKTNEVVVAAMEKLSDKTKNVRNITDLILGISGQTNLLALNASIEAARAEGIQAEGPVPPDTVFSKARGGWYDIVVAMYHDQGHIPLKVVGFVYDRDKQAWDAVAGVNITLGLPIIRVSVDHGTAFDQAGTGTASELSLKNSLEYAVMFARNRKQQRV